jgi:hypothetical protein
MSSEQEREFMRAALEARQMEEAPLLVAAVCLGCGCTQDCACPGGCYWICVSEERGVGICSTCAGVPIRDLENRRVIV